MVIRKDLIPGITVVIVFIVGVIIYFNYDMNRKGEIIKQFNSEYSLISTKECINGVVTYIYSPDLLIFRYDSTFAGVILNDSTKKRIITTFELDHDFPMNRILKVGNRLIKRCGSDKLYLYQGDTLKYSFELLDDLGYSIRDRANQ